MIRIFSFHNFFHTRIDWSPFYFKLNWYFNSDLGSISFSPHRVVTILCGGNIDTTVLGRCLERGLAADGRLLSFTVVVKDAPGGMNSLTQMLTDTGAR